MAEDNSKKNIDSIAINDYLEVIKKEYDNERGKKQSFETRAGFIITIVSAIYAFIMDKVKFSDIQNIIDKPLYFIGVIKIIIFIFIYLSFCYTIYASIMVIYTKEHKNFNIENITGNLLASNRLEGIVEIIRIYKEIIKDHRLKNDIRAKYLNSAFLGIAINLVLISLYINII